MAFTRFHDDEGRIDKQNQQMTDPGRWILDVPGWGTTPQYMADPQMRIQTWGANLMTNSLDIESELRGYTRPISRDCLGKDEYTRTSNLAGCYPISYPINNTMHVSESRTTLPAWTFRDAVQPRWAYLPLNPQENTCFPFQNNFFVLLNEQGFDG